MTRALGACTLLLTFVIGSVPGTAHAAELYVATTGSNGNAGTSAAAAWATLQHAADRVNPGDTVHVAAGTYVGFYLDRGGTAAMPVRFVAEGAVSIGTRNGTTPDGINVEGADHVTIEGFTVNGMPRAGLRCALSSFVTFRGNHADMNGRWGILTGCCPDLLIEDNETSHSVAEHGIYVSNSADRPVIRNNVSWGNHANGIHMNGDASIDCGGITAFDGVISGARVEGNLIYDNGTAGGSGINCDGVADSVILNNLIYDAHASGISLYQIDAGMPATGNRVVYNTIMMAADGRWGINIADGSTGNFIANNVILTAHAFRGAITITDDSLTGFSSDYNVLTPRLSPDGDSTTLDLAQWQALGYDTHSIASTPAAVFVALATDDYHLPATSPAVDAATTSFAAPATDREGHARPMGAGPDIGALERLAPGFDAGPVDAATTSDAGTMGDASTSADADSGTDGASIVDASTGRDARMGGADAGTAPPGSAGCGCRAGTGETRLGWPLLALAAWLATRRGARGRR